MIETNGLTKYYGDRAAIKDVSFRVARGEVLGFLGPNGAGKTTTMRILTSFMPASEGTARVAGYDVFQDSLEVRRRIGYLPETVPLYTDMTARGYLDYVASLRAVPHRQNRVAEVMESCGVTDRADILIAKLSKGYKQRVGIAQALVHDPEVLILDEPTIGLDPRQIVEVRELIKELGETRTVILSTHILSEVSQICERVIIINEGHIVASDTPENLTAMLEGASRIHLRVADPTDGIPETLVRLEGVSSVIPTAKGAYDLQCTKGTELRPAIAELVVRNGWGLLEMRAVEMSLEEIFMKLTTE